MALIAYMCVYMSVPILHFFHSPFLLLVSVHLSSMSASLLCFVNKIIYSVCFFAAAAAAAKSLQSCPALCSPIDGSPPGSSIHGIFQARVLERAAISFSDSVSLYRVFPIYSICTYALKFDIRFSLSDSLPFVWLSLGPATSLQMTQFLYFLWLNNIPLRIKSFILSSEYTEWHFVS